MPAPLLAALAGLGFGLSLIVAIGAQNAFVLRQGLIRNHVFIIVAICAVADLALIFAGIAGLGALITSVGWLLPAIELVGGVFVATYGIFAAKRAISSESLAPTAQSAGLTTAAAITTTLGLTLLNPHVYLDTVLLLGSVASTYGFNRWWFGLGAGIGSIAWFFSLGFGARMLRPVFAKPLAWRILDIAIAIVMFVIAATLLVGFVQHVTVPIAQA
jgi:L-lysine exporter family protein LysE/ArgO